MTQLTVEWMDGRIEIFTEIERYGETHTLGTTYDRRQSDPPNFLSITTKEQRVFIPMNSIRKYSIGTVKRERKVKVSA